MKLPRAWEARGQGPLGMRRARTPGEKPRVQEKWLLRPLCPPRGGGTRPWGDRRAARGRGAERAVQVRGASCKQAQEAGKHGWWGRKQGAAWGRPRAGGALAGGGETAGGGAGPLPPPAPDVRHSALTWRTPCSSLVASCVQMLSLHLQGEPSTLPQAGCRRRPRPRVERVAAGGRARGLGAWEAAGAGAGAGSGTRFPPRRQGRVSPSNGQRLSEASVCSGGATEQVGGA